MLYRLKVAVLKTKLGNRLWRKLMVRMGRNVGDYGRLPEYIRNYTSGKSFVDVGCMWGVNGEYAFLAEEAGATTVKGVDVFGPTPEFEDKKRARKSNVEFVLGDIGRPETLNAVGPTDVVFCAGVLYHHPSPYDLLYALRLICRDTLILRTSTIPERGGTPNFAVYWPMLNEDSRQMWNLASLGLLNQVGISNAFQPQEGYGNWFWGMTPSCLVSLVQTAGFRIEWQFEEAFAQTLICKVVEQPFAHSLPDAMESKAMAERISQLGIARPA